MVVSIIVLRQLGNCALVGEYSIRSQISSKLQQTLLPLVATGVNRELDSEDETIETRLLTEQSQEFTLPS